RALLRLLRRPPFGDPRSAPKERRTRVWIEVGDVREQPLRRNRSRIRGERRGDVRTLQLALPPRPDDGLERLRALRHASEQGLDLREESLAVDMRGHVRPEEIEHARRDT